MFWNREPITYSITDPGEAANSTKLLLNGVTLERLEIALGLIDNKYTGYRFEDAVGTPRFVLMIYESGGKDRIPLPTPLDAKTMARLVFQWLANLTDVQYGRQPDVDGTIKRGWVAKTEFGGDWYSVVAVEPQWIVYGK